MNIVNKKINSFLAGILSFILMFFIWHKFLSSGNTIIFIMFFLISFLFFKRVIENEYKRKFIVTITIAIIFSVIEIICGSINTDYTLRHVLNKWSILDFFGYLVLIWSTISFIYSVNIKENNKRKECRNHKIYQLIFDSKDSFYINIILIVLSWMPYFLTYYPGILTADSCVQIGQVLGVEKLTNHHPIVHTGIISIFINFGKNIVGNINIGVSLYIIFQMIAMAVMFSEVLKYMNKKNVPYMVREICLLYYMFYPINALFSVIMWKDILFSGIVPVYIIFNIELLYNTEEFFENKKSIIKYISVSLLVMFLRNNGLYVVLLTLPLILISLRKYLKKVVIIIIAIIVLYLTIKSAIFNVFNVKKRLCRRTAFDTVTTNRKGEKKS